jgi:GTP cyclohydrolase I/GTP cyclohydrolase-4
MVGGVIEALPWLPDDGFVSARQENLETIHQHNVVAERYGTLGELRDEMRSGQLARRHTELRSWLES